MKTFTYFAVALVSAVKASKIIYRDDVDVSQYRVDRTLYPHSFPWPADNPICGATMISPQHAITAAHCLERDGNTQDFEIELSGNRYTVEGKRPNDCYDLMTGLPNPADMAILVLKDPIPNAVEGTDYVKVWNADVSGDMTDKNFTLVGWGGSGPIGSYDFQYGIFHAGQNTVNAINDNMLIYTMDRESDGGLPLEAIGYSGDSGSAALVDVNGTWQIAGVKSNGEGPAWGSEAEYTRLGGLGYQWIQDNIQFNEDGTPVDRVSIPSSQCATWNDPSGDGSPWAEFFNTFDTSPRDNKITLQEFTSLYNLYNCSNEGVQQMFNRLDENNNDQITVPEFKKAWEYFAGWDCQLFYGDEGGDGGDGDDYGEDDYGSYGSYDDEGDNGEDDWSYGDDDYNDEDGDNGEDDWSYGDDDYNDEDGDNGEDDWSYGDDDYNDEDGDNGEDDWSYGDDEGDNGEDDWSYGDDDYYDYDDEGGNGEDDWSYGDDDYYDYDDEGNDGDDNDNGEDEYGDDFDWDDFDWEDYGDYGDDDEQNWSDYGDYGDDDEYNWSDYGDYGDDQDWDDYGDYGDDDFNWDDYDY